MDSFARPVKPTPHAIMDYGLVVFTLLAPTLFPSMPDASKVLCYIVGVGEFLFIALTAHGVSLMRLISMPLHGLLEYPVLMAIAVAAWAAGSFNDPTARWVFLGIIIGALVLHFLTDFKAESGLTPGSARPGRSGGPQHA